MFDEIAEWIIMSNGFWMAVWVATYTGLAFTLMRDKDADNSTKK